MAIPDDMREILIQRAEEARPGQVQAEQTRVKSWLRIAAYTIFVLMGLSTSTLSSSLYFKNGGNSKWMAALVTVAGFPILLPIYILASLKRKTTPDIQKSSHSALSVGLIYLVIGLLIGASSVNLSVGILDLPVSTFSLICASQLAFNALFSYFINAQTFPPLIILSLLLLTGSSVVPAFQTDSHNPTSASTNTYVRGFICTLFASAAQAMGLTLTQFSFRKILTKTTFSVRLATIIYMNMVAASAIIVGLFVSGDWKNIKGEIENCKAGKLFYFVNLVSISAAWQIFNMGITGLIFEVSSLFANAISVLGLPMTSILAVIIFHEDMNGMKAIAVALALCGFGLHVYQHHLDHKKSKTAPENECYTEVTTGDR